MWNLVQQTFGVSLFRLCCWNGEILMVKLFKNRETMETTADYGKALDWRKDGDRVSEYQKVGEL
jgi:hypothetical protein